MVPTVICLLGALLSTAPTSDALFEPRVDLPAGAKRLSDLLTLVTNQTGIEFDLPQPSGRDQPGGWRDPVVRSTLTAGSLEQVLAALGPQAAVQFVSADGGARFIVTAVAATDRQPPQPPRVELDGLNLVLNGVRAEAIDLVTWLPWQALDEADAAAPSRRRLSCYLTVSGASPLHLAGVVGLGPRPTVTVGNQVLPVWPGGATLARRADGLTAHLPFTLDRDHDVTDLDQLSGELRRFSAVTEETVTLPFQAPVTTATASGRRVAVGAIEPASEGKGAVCLLTLNASVEPAIDPSLAGLLERRRLRGHLGPALPTDTRETDRLVSLDLTQRPAAASDPLAERILAYAAEPAAGLAPRVAVDSAERRRYLPQQIGPPELAAWDGRVLAVSRRVWLPPLPRQPERLVVALARPAGEVVSAEWTFTGISLTGNPARRRLPD